MINFWTSVGPFFGTTIVSTPSLRLTFSEPILEHSASGRQCYVLKSELMVGKINCNVQKPSKFPPASLIVKKFSVGFWGSGFCC